MSGGGSGGGGLSQEGVEQRDLGDYYNEHRHGIRLDSSDPLRLDDPDDLTLDNGASGDHHALEEDDDDEPHSPGSILLHGSASFAHHSQDLDQNNGERAAVVVFLPSYE